MMLCERLSRKKHMREDGWLVELVSKAYKDEPFNCLHTYMVSIEPGCSRAGHYHNRKEEWFSIAYGKIKLTLEDINQRRKEEMVLDAGAEEYEIMRIPPGTAHLITNFSDKEKAVLVVFSEHVHDPTDTIEYKFR